MIQEVARWEGEVEEWEAVVESPCGYLARGSEELIEVAKISVFVCLPIMSFRVDQTTGYLGLGTGYREEFFK